MTSNAYIYIFTAAIVSYLIRVLPLTLIRKPINNRFIKSFLYYVPYVTLAVMTFPAIIEATQSPHHHLRPNFGSSISCFTGLLFKQACSLPSDWFNCNFNLCCNIYHHQSY